MSERVTQLDWGAATQMDSTGFDTPITPPGALALPDVEAYLGVKEPARPALFSIVDGPMPPANVADRLILEARIRHQHHGCFLGKTSLTLGGCITRPDLPRNCEGYTVHTNPAKYGVLPVSRWYRDRGMPLHRLEIILDLQDRGERSPWAEYIDPDYVEKNGDLPDDGRHINHKCRNHMCCRPDHTNALTNQANNADKRAAMSFEKRLDTPQVMIGITGLGWYDQAVEAATEPDTNIWIFTSRGLYRVIKLDDSPTRTMLEPLDDPVFNQRPAPWKNNRNFRSRARSHQISDGQTALFDRQVYRRSRRPKLTG